MHTCRNQHHHHLLAAAQDEPNASEEECSYNTPSSSRHRLRMHIDGIKWTGLAGWLAGCELIKWTPHWIRRFPNFAMDLHLNELLMRVEYLSSLVLLFGFSQQLLRYHEYLFFFCFQSNCHFPPKSDDYDDFYWHIRNCSLGGKDWNTSFFIWSVQYRTECELTLQLVSIRLILMIRGTAQPRCTINNIWNGSMSEGSMSERVSE